MAANHGLSPKLNPRIDYHKMVDHADGAFERVCDLTTLINSARKRELDRLERTTHDVKGVHRELQNVGSLVQSVRNERDLAIAASSRAAHDRQRIVREKSQENAQLVSRLEEIETAREREQKVRHDEAARVAQVTKHERERAQRAEDELAEIRRSEAAALQERDSLRRTVEDIQSKEKAAVLAALRNAEADESLQTAVVQLRETEKQRAAAERELSANVERASAEQQAHAEELAQVRLEGATAVERLESALGNATEELDSTRTKLSAATRDVEKMRATLREKERQREEGLNEVRTAAEHSREEVANLSENARAAQTELAEARGDSAQLRQQLATAKLELQELRGEAESTATSSSKRLQELQLATRAERDRESATRDRLERAVKDLSEQLDSEKVRLQRHIRDVEASLEEERSRGEKLQRLGEAERRDMERTAARQSEAAARAAAAELERANIGIRERAEKLEELRATAQSDLQSWAKQRGELQQQLLDATASAEDADRARSAAVRAQSLAEEQLVVAENARSALRFQYDELLEAYEKMGNEKATYTENELESIQARLEAERSRSAALEELSKVSSLERRHLRENRRLQIRTSFWRWKCAWVDWSQTTDLRDERLLYRIQTVAEEMGSSAAEQEQLVAQCQENFHRLRELELIKHELEGELVQARRERDETAEAVQGQTATLSALRQQLVDVHEATAELRRVQRRQDADLVEQLCASNLSLPGGDESPSEHLHNGASRGRETIGDLGGPPPMFTQDYRRTSDLWPDRELPARPDALDAESSEDSSSGSSARSSPRPTSGRSTPRGGRRILGDGPVVKVANFAELEQRNAVLYAVAKLWGSKLARAEEIVEAQALLLRTRREHVELELLVRDLGLSSAMPTSDGAFEEEKAPGLRARGSPSPATSRAARSRAFDALVKMIPALCDHLENDVVSGISRTRRAMQKCVAIRKKLFKDTEGAVDDAVQARSSPFSAEQHGDEDAFRALMRLSRIALAAQKWHRLREKMIHIFDVEALEFQLNHVVEEAGAMVASYSDTTAFATTSAAEDDDPVDRKRSPNFEGSAGSTGVEDSAVDAAVASGYDYQGTFDFNSGLQSQEAWPETPGTLKVDFSYMGMAPGLDELVLG